MPEANSSAHCFFLPVFLLPLFSLSSVFQLCLWIGFLHSEHEYTKVSSILGENKITLLLSLLSPVFSLPYLSWESYLNECSLFPSSLPHLPFATEPRMCVHAKSLQLCSNSVTPWTLPDCCAQEIFQTRILEWVVMPSSRGSSQPRDQTQSPTLQFGPRL